MPYPALDGGAQAVHTTTAGLLAKDLKLKVVALNHSRNKVDVCGLPEDYLNQTHIETVNLDTRIKPLHILINLFAKRSYFIERFCSREFEGLLKKVLVQEDFDIIQLEHLYMCHYLETCRRYSKAKIVLRPQNVEFIIWERYLENLKEPLNRYFIKLATERLKKFETETVKKLDGIIAITMDDAKVFRAYANGVPVIDVPMGFNYYDLKEYCFHEGAIQQPNFYHLGSMDWLPNLEAVKWFLKHVYPIVTNQFPGIKIYIAGRKMPKELLKIRRENIVIEDEIRNPLKYQEDKTVMIVPLLSGSGIRAKIVEGLALGKTIISTTVGAQGINYIHDENLIIADSPEDFAFQMGRCYTSTSHCKRIGENAKKLSVLEYNYIGSAKKMIEFYKILSNTA